MDSYHLPKDVLEFLEEVPLQLTIILTNKVLENKIQSDIIKTDISDHFPRLTVLATNETCSLEKTKFIKRYFSSENTDTFKFLLFDCESFLEPNSPDILALCETNLDDSIDSGNFSVRGYLHLIRKDSSTYMHGLAVCEGRSSFCTGLISRKLCRFLLMFSTCFTSLSVLLLFPLSITFFLIMHGF